MPPRKFDPKTIGKARRQRELDMHIDPKVPIAGIKVAALKRVFQGGRFATTGFIRLTGVAGDGAGRALGELVDLGWLEQDPVKDGWWVTTAQADRLVATPLLPRLPLARARDLVGRVIQVAEEVNRDASHFHIVEKVAVFGSVQSGGHDGTVGDVDLGVHLGKRERDPQLSSALYDADLAARPETFRKPSYFWPSERVMKRLKVHRQISLHELAEVHEQGFDNALVYVWDRCAGSGVISLPWQATVALTSR